MSDEKKPKDSDFVKSDSGLWIPKEREEATVIPPVFKVKVRGFRP